VTLTVDLQRTPGLGICADVCDGPCVVTEHGTCERCGSSSVVRPFSLAATLSRDRLVLDPKFLRGERWARANEEARA